MINIPGHKSRVKDATSGTLTCGVLISAESKLMWLLVIAINGGLFETLQGYPL